jgi:hypothetical protein
MNNKETTTRNQIKRIMFDGNHRGRRRAVNLGGKSTSQKSRAGILEQSKKSRIQRLLVVQQNSSAVCIQRHVQGSLCW